MPRYFFHVHDGVQNIDREGAELRGPDKAHSQAILAAGDMLKDVDGYFTRGTWSMRVLDEHGGIVSDVMITVRRNKPA